MTTPEAPAVRAGGPSIAAVLFVVALPLVCLFVDPMVFRSREREMFAMFEPAWAFRAQLLWLAAVLALLGGWALLPARGRAAAALLAALAGVHFVAGLAALVLGFTLVLPTVTVCCCGPGLLGPTPLVVAVLLFRHGVRALRNAAFGGLACAALAVAGAAAALLAVHLGTTTVLVRAREGIRVCVTTGAQPDGELAFYAACCDVRMLVGDVIKELPASERDAAWARSREIWSFPT